MKLHYTFLFICSVLTASAQPVMYNHYFLNPFLYNPSYVAADGYKELNLNYRRQWTDFEDAPATGTVSVHLPLSHKIGIGITGISDKAGAWNATTGLVTFGYHIYLSQPSKELHKISFGISAGMMSSGIRRSVADIPDDPVVGMVSSMAARFGMHYQRNGLRVSFALPRLFDNPLSVTDTRSGEFSPVDETVSSASYRIPLGPKLGFEPLLVYRTYQLLEAQFEGAGALRFGDVAWVGGSYNNDLGAAAFAGISLKQRLKVSYAYNFPGQNISSTSQELQVSLQFGQQKSARDKVRVSRPAKTPVAPPLAQYPAADVPADTATADIPALREPEVSQPEHAAPTAPVVPPDVKTEESMPKGYYVVVGAFRFKSNGFNYRDKLVQAGYPADVVFYTKRQYYIVFMKRANTVEEARELTLKYRQMSRYSFRDTWILTIE